METISLSDHSLTRYLLGSIVALWGIYIWKVVYDSCVRHLKMMKLAKAFPGPPTIPLLGNAWEFVKNLGNSFELIVQIAEKYPTTRIWLGPRLMIMITDPKDIEIVMMSHKTSKKGFGYEFMKPAVNNSLINGYGPEMRAHRKLLVPLINGDNLKNYTKMFNKQIRYSVDELTKKMGAKEFDIYDEIENCIADIAFETILGIPGVAQDHGDLTLPHATVVGLDILYQRVITPWLHPSFIFNHSQDGKTFGTAVSTVHKFLSKVIKGKRELYMNLVHSKPVVDKPKSSILDKWMEDVVKTNMMSDKEILDDTIALFIGFHDTVLGVFSFAILMLAMHPHVQEKVREEVISVIGTDNDITEENIGRLEYTKMVIKETIRLFPPGPFLMREVTEDLEIGTNKYTLPKGSTVAVVATVTHRSEEYWHEPNKFIPERFLPEHSKDRHPFAFIPFSGGSRRCPGTKFGMTCLKVMIAHFIRNCRVATSMNFESLKLKMHISVRSQDGYKVSIEKIHR